MKRTFSLIISICMAVVLMNTVMTMQSQAADYSTYQIEGMQPTIKSLYMLKAAKSGVDVRDGASYDCEQIATVAKGNTYEVLENRDAGWVKVKLSEDETGFINIGDGAYVYETVTKEVDDEMALRQEIVSYALSFVGNRYVYGGTDPHTGADCSGFTSYVMRKIAGINLTHSSRAQASEGKSVKLSELKPGDLVFYSSGGSIDHVAIYMGDGQIVHASSSKTGIKVSSLNNSRTPVKMVDVVR